MGCCRWGLCGSRYFLGGWVPALNHTVIESLPPAVTWKRKDCSQSGWGHRGEGWQETESLTGLLCKSQKREAAKARECRQTLAASKVRLPHPKLSKRLQMNNSIATKVTAVGDAR